MKREILRMLTVAWLPIAIVGCRPSSDSPLASSDGTSSATVEESGAAVATVAVGHFPRQSVNATDPDGSQSVASFTGTFHVFGNGSARGSFSLFSGGSMQVFQIENGRIGCEAGTPVVILTGTVRGMPSKGPASLGFEVELTPVGGDDDDSGCLIWDIKDGCSYEAQGRFDLVSSPCPRM